MSRKYDYMVIVAHPDDAEFGVAGSIAGWTAVKKSAVYVVCTNGDKGSSDRSVSPRELAQIRQAEQRRAAQIVGVEDVVFLNMVDQELEETPAFREEIVRLIRKFRPDTVVSMDPYRRYLWHRDHRVLGQVVMDALFPYARDHMSYPRMLEEGLDPHKVKEVLYFGTEDVNYHVDISETFSTKLAALRCHKSQVKGFNVNDLESWLKKRCEQMAEGSTCKLAEAFHRVKLPD